MNEIQIENKIPNSVCFLEMVNLAKGAGAEWGRKEVFELVKRKARKTGCPLQILYLYHDQLYLFSTKA